jgi:hypothetical protein
MHGRVPDAAGLWRSLPPKEGLTPIQPRERIFFVFKGRELEADARMDVGVVVGVLLSTIRAVRRLLRAERLP